MKLYVEKGTDKEISTWNMYELVFQDMVESYLADMNYTEEKLTLSASEIKEIANKLLFKSEYMRETINETIDAHIGNLLNKRSDK